MVRRLFSYLASTRHRQPASLLVFIFVDVLDGQRILLGFPLVSGQHILLGFASVDGQRSLLDLYCLATLAFASRRSLLPLAFASRRSFFPRDALAFAS